MNPRMSPAALTRAMVSNVRPRTCGAAARCGSTSVSAGTSPCSCQWPESPTRSVSAIGRLQRSSPRPRSSSGMLFTGHLFASLLGELHGMADALALCTPRR